MILSFLMTAYIRSSTNAISRTNVLHHSIPYYIPCQFHFLCFHIQTPRMIPPSLALTAHAHPDTPPSVPFSPWTMKPGRISLNILPGHLVSYVTLFLLSVSSGYPLFLLNARTPAASTAAAAAAAANGSTFAVSPVLTDLALEFCDPAVFPAAEALL